jgi:two-component system NtrC family sensor kinase
LGDRAARPHDAEAMRSFFDESALMHSVAEVEGNDFRYVTVNASAAAHVGRTPAEVEGRTASEIGVPRHVLEAWLPVILAALAENRTKRTDFSARGRTMSSTIIPLGRGASGSLRFGFVTEDVTERTQLKDHLELAERRALVGSVAAGAAHEIKNPLAFVSANLAFAREELEARNFPRQEEILTALKEAAEGLGQIGALSNDLVALSRAGPSAPVLTDVGAIVQRAAGLSRIEIRKTARLDLQVQPASPVMADPVRLEQVVLNLLINAVAAMRSVERAEHVLGVRVSKVEGGTAIEVEDTGCGIAPENLARVFEPFFTTKGKSGTGLGLALSAEFVRAMGGQLTVSSRPGQGAVFRVVLHPLLG